VACCFARCIAVQLHSLLCWLRCLLLHSLPARPVTTRTRCSFLKVCLFADLGMFADVYHGCLPPNVYPCKSDLVYIMVCWVSTSWCVGCVHHGVLGVGRRVSSRCVVSCISSSCISSSCISSSCISSRASRVVALVQCGAQGRVAITSHRTLDDPNARGRGLCAGVWRQLQWHASGRPASGATWTRCRRLG